MPELLRCGWNVQRTLPVVGVDIEHVVERRADVDVIADLERGRVDLAGGRGRHRPERHRPGGRELADIAAVDLAERREMAAAAIVAEVEPVARGIGGDRRLGRARRGRGEARGRPDRERQHRGGADHQPAALAVRLDPAGQRDDQERQPQHQRRDHPRHQRPAVEPDFEQRPDQREQQQHAVDRRARPPVALEHIVAGQQRQQARGQIVPRSAQPDQLRPAQRKQRADQHEQQAVNHTADSPDAFHSLSLPLWSPDATPMLSRRRCLAGDQSTPLPETATSATPIDGQWALG